MTTLKSATLNGKSIGYSSETVFLVQVSKNRNSKSGYVTKYSFKGELGKACFHYDCINIGNGYRKRLVMPSSKKPVLARQAS